MSYISHNANQWRLLIHPCCLLNSHFPTEFVTQALCETNGKINLDDIIRVKEQNPDEVIGVRFSNCGKLPPELQMILYNCIYRLSSTLYDE